MLKWIKLNLEKVKIKLRKKGDVFLQDKHDHFFFQLPDNIGLFLTFILKLFFSGIMVTEEQTHNLKNLQKEGACCLCY